jgi:hypothetical protein
MTQPDFVPYRMSEVPAEPSAPVKHGGDILSLICGILALLCVLAGFVHLLRLFFVLPGLVFAIIALVSGHIAMRQRRTSRGFAIAGLVLGYGAIIVLLLSVVGTVILRILTHRRFIRRSLP